LDFLPKAKALRPDAWCLPIAGQPQSISQCSSRDREVPSQAAFRRAADRGIEISDACERWARFRRLIDQICSIAAFEAVVPIVDSSWHDSALPTGRVSPFCSGTSDVNLTGNDQSVITARSISDRTGGPVFLPRAMARSMVMPIFTFLPHGGPPTITVSAGTGGPVL
jgi:hypothetical protein